jgi:HPt (histidine-containing phosphotransfer) domain-containing protein
MYEDTIPGTGWKVNTASLFNLCNGDKPFFVKMVLLFIRSAGETVTRMEEELSRKNYTAVAGFAHQLAPSCRQLEAKSMLVLVKKIESSIRETKNYESISILVQKIKSETAEVMEQLFVELKNAGYT